MKKQIIFLSVVVFFTLSCNLKTKEYTEEDIAERAINWVEGIYGKNSMINNEVEFLDAIKLEKKETKPISYVVEVHFLEKGFGGIREYTFELYIQEEDGKLKVKSRQIQNSGNSNKCNKSNSRKKKGKKKKLSPEEVVNRLLKKQ